MVIYDVTTVRYKYIHHLHTLVDCSMKHVQLECLLIKFGNFCLPQKNPVYEMHKFFSYTQQPSETIDSFSTELKARATSCDVGEIENKLIMSQKSQRFNK